MSWLLDILPFGDEAGTNPDYLDAVQFSKKHDRCSRQDLSSAPRLSGDMLARLAQKEINPPSQNEAKSPFQVGRAREGFGQRVKLSKEGILTSLGAGGAGLAWLYNKWRSMGKLLPVP